MSKKVVLIPLSTLRYHSDPPVPPPPPTTRLAHQEHTQYNQGLRGTSFSSNEDLGASVSSVGDLSPETSVATVEKKSSKKSSFSLFNKVASAAKSAALTVKSVGADVSVSMHRTIRDVSNSSDQDLFSSNFPTLAAQGSVLCSTHTCAALSGGLLVYGTLFVSSTSLCFLGTKHRDAMTLMDVASYLPSITFEIDPSSVEGKRAAALAHAQQAAVGNTGTAPTAGGAQDSKTEGDATTAPPLSESGFGDEKPKPATQAEAPTALPPGIMAPYIMGIPAPNVVPTCLQVFTTSGQLYQFVDFTETKMSSAANIGVKQTSAERACRYVDECWRKAVAAHNRAVVTETVSGSGSTLHVENGRMVDQSYAAPHHGVGNQVGPEISQEQRFVGRDALL